MRRWRRYLAALAALYALVLTILLAGENRLLFPGWAFPKAWEGPSEASAAEPAAIATGNENTIEAWWLAGPDWTPDRGAVLYLHGNGENLAACAHTLLRWRDQLHRGVLGIDYPGYGHSTGSPNERSCCDAAQAAFQWIVREKKVPGGDVVVIGQSLGSAIAIDLAAHEPCRLLLVSGAFTSFPDIAQTQYFWLPARYLVRTRFDNAAKIGQVKAPIFFSHGTRDHVVPFSQGKQLYALASPPKQFFEATGQGHAQPKSPEYYGAVRAFLARTAPDRARAASPP